MEEHKLLRLAPQLYKTVNLYDHNHNPKLSFTPLPLDYYSYESLPAIAVVP